MERMAWGLCSARSAMTCTPGCAEHGGDRRGDPLADLREAVMVLVGALSGLRNSDALRCSEDAERDILESDEHRE